MTLSNRVQEAAYCRLEELGLIIKNFGTTEVIANAEDVNTRIQKIKNVEKTFTTYCFRVSITCQVHQITNGYRIYISITPVDVSR